LRQNAQAYKRTSISKLKTEVRRNLFIDKLNGGSSLVCIVLYYSFVNE